jgi:hypothetical protein
MDENNLKERDFHVYVGWKIPFFIKFAWVVLILWGLVYGVMYITPDLKMWLNK